MRIQKTEKSQWKPHKLKQKKRVRNQDTNSCHDRIIFHSKLGYSMYSDIKTLKTFRCNFWPRGKL